MRWGGGDVWRFLKLVIGVRDLAEFFEYFFQGPLRPPPSRCAARALRVLSDAERSLRDAEAEINAWDGERSTAP